MEISKVWKRAGELLLYMGLDRKQYRQVKAAIDEDNRRSVLAWSVCTGLFWLMSLGMSLGSDAYRACRFVYLAALGADVLCNLGARTLAKDRPGWLKAVIALLLLSVLGAGVGIAMCQPDVRTASMIAFAVIVPTCVISNSLTDTLLHLFTILAYVLLARGVIEPAIYSWGLTNLIIFSVAGILAGHVINRSRAERYVYAESARQLADIQTKYAYYDQMTGLRNRRACTEYWKQLKEQPPETLCVIMADLNGLKRTNDSLGHEAGDELIVGAAECLKAAFPGTDSIYRLGGDEFCVLLPDTEEVAGRCLAELERRIAAWKGHRVQGLSLSWGLATNRESGDLDAVRRQADQKMYENKREYYRSSGMDRRRR